MSDFVIKRNFTQEYACNLGNAGSPPTTRKKRYFKGTVIKGEVIKDKDGKPTIVMHEGVVPIQLSNVKQIRTTEIGTPETSNADAEVKPEIKGQIAVSKTGVSTQIDTKKKYVDAIVLGSVLGYVGVYFAEKKGWIVAGEGSKNKLIGAVIGAMAGIYVVYRFGNKIYNTTPPVIVSNNTNTNTP